MNDIFSNQDEVIGNIEESARELGANITPKSQAAGPLAKPKRNCKLCYGRGYVVMSFPGNDGNEDIYKTYCRCVKVL